MSRATEPKNAPIDSDDAREPEADSSVIVRTGTAVETPVAGETPVEEVVIGARRAVDALHDAFGSLVDADYLPGKTLFRDALCERLGVTALQAEELVDELEAMGRLRFVSSEEGIGWHVRADA
jgi:hypothetical protein